MEQATAQSGFGDMSISKKSQAPQFILGISAFPGSKAAGKETHARQEQTKPGPTPFQS